MSIEEFPIETKTQSSLDAGTPDLSEDTGFFFWLASAPKRCTLAAIKAALAIMGLPPGGTTGQILVKASEDDGDAEWADAPEGGGGGVEEAPEDGTLYARQDGEWVAAPSGGGGDPIIPDVGVEMLEGAIARYNGHLYMATADTENTSAPSPTGEDNVNPDLLHVGPAWPKCTLRLPYGVLIDATPGTALEAQLFNAADYTRDTNFKGAMTIGGDPPQDGTAGDVVFTPGDSSKIYEFEIFGTTYNDAAGKTALSWPMNSGATAMIAQGAETSAANAAPMLSAVKRMPGAWGATGALASLGGVASAVENGITLRITQRDA